ncbi:hypothetical protein RB195_021331 [Necator americanus]|uniref:Centromere protein J C-terminal domain-containing protein n=1 Tax=Necator americanus TaxID=51031 RepID=A0ABR1EAM4_NECAM
MGFGGVLDDSTFLQRVGSFCHITVSASSLENPIPSENNTENASEETNSEYNESDCSWRQCSTDEETTPLVAEYYPNGNIKIVLHNCGTLKTVFFPDGRIKEEYDRNGTLKVKYNEDDEPKEEEGQNHTGQENRILYTIEELSEDSTNNNI